MTVVIMYAVVIVAILSAVVVAAMKDTRLAKAAARASAERPTRWM